MSLSNALSNALSGLNASARGAGIVASNLANVMTEGYAVRELSLSARGDSASGGVTVNGVNRLTDTALIADRRLADAETADAEIRLEYLERLGSLAGDPTEERALTGLLAEFESSVISAASLPESESRLEAVLQSAKGITDHLNSLSDGLQALRAEADRQIGQKVSRLNTVLGAVEKLNHDIIAAQSHGRDTAGLMDQRQAAIDEISAIVPVRELKRDFGAVALMTPGGAVLLDGKAAAIGFGSRNTVAPHMTLENGLLSAVTVNGKPGSAADDKALAGGSLAGLFAVRDELFVDVQMQLDTVAQDLVERFQSGVDPTLAAGQPGLFTDDGQTVQTQTGLAARISVNQSVDPGRGGDLWRLKDGLEATQPGDSGNADLLQSMLDALAKVRQPSTSSLGSTERSAATFASDFGSSVWTRINRQDQSLSYAASRQSKLAEMELSLGVDSDAELQKLLLIEQAYAANAKIIQAVDDMLQQLMEIG
ncbi:flagellar hook-associated protein FlgK [Thalassovita sp.]|uniref:flagellar hook-associated protein FlgK n=1 Tax=Thalassovita sp. TaxID=1979401 RepID=UPI0029DE606C|nr:flagellar hook-associated protein FlgK [Thalassovita sp.]